MQRALSIVAPNYWGSILEVYIKSTNKNQAQITLTRSQSIGVTLAPINSADKLDSDNTDSLDVTEPISTVTDTLTMTTSDSELRTNQSNSFANNSKKKPKTRV